MEGILYPHFAGIQNRNRQIIVCAPFIPEWYKESQIWKREKLQ